MRQYAEDSIHGLTRNGIDELTVNCEQLYYYVKDSCSAKVNSHIYCIIDKDGKVVLDSTRTKKEDFEMFNHISFRK